MNKKWVITSDSIFDGEEILYLAWQRSVWNEDGYFWADIDVMKELIEKERSTQEHPFVFVSRNAAIRKLKKLDIPQKCRVVKWMDEPTT